MLSFIDYPEKLENAVERQIPFCFITDYLQRTDQEKKCNPACQLLSISYWWVF